MTKAPRHKQLRTIHSLLDKPMDRKEFLIYVGTLFLVVTGVAGLMGALHDLAFQPKTMARKHTPGFGYGPYGGTKGGAS